MSRVLEARLRKLEERQSEVIGRVRYVVSDRPPGEDDGSDLGEPRPPMTIEEWERKFCHDESRH
jgi:hypothetical protein